MNFKDEPWLRREKSSGYLTMLLALLLIMSVVLGVAAAICYGFYQAILLVIQLLT